MSQSLEDLFNSIPLPYKYVKIPNPNDPPVVRDKKLKFFVNQVITDLSKNAFIHSGFEQTEDPVHWNTSWGRQFVINRYRSCKSWQKINHFAGAFFMGQKGYFNKRMAELKERIGDEANFYPESFLLPDEKAECEKHYKDHRLWIIKPLASSRGRGIYVVNSSNTGLPEEPAVVQYYIEHPLLITGRKFDIRVYTIVTSASPIRIYFHDSGLIRFATHQYDPNADPSDAQTHLTNFALNKDDPNFIRCEDDGEEKVSDSKWSIPFFIEYLKSNSIDPVAVFAEIERVVTKALLAGMSTIQSHHARQVQHRHTSYEQYGLDVIFDENFHAYVMEVNISPGMSGTDSKLDHNIKWRLMHDVLNMARIIDCDANSNDPCPGIDEIERQCNLSLTNERNRAVRTKKISAWDDPVFVDYMMVRDFIEEKSRLGGYHRIFPKRKTVDDYQKCIGDMKYQDVAFIDWIKMDKNKRKEALMKNWDKYKETLEKINKEFGLNENQSQDPSASTAADEDDEM